METLSHQAEVIRQFTLQAKPFASHQAHSAQASLDSLRDLAGLDGTQRVLDAGCGPGLVSCYVSAYAGEVVGLDLTEAMIAQARAAADEKALDNVQFVSGNIAAMPFADGVFDATVSRYVFHHLNEPADAFAEMARVTRSGGRIVVADATPPAAKRAAYDTFEIMRDPSHTSALTIEELLAMGERFRLGDATIRRFGVRMELDSLLDASFPDPGRREALVQMMHEDFERDAMGFSARDEGGRCYLTFPVTAIGWTKPSRCRKVWAV